jgi:uncharacterized protein YndB with AHSA1/START domain
MSLITPPNARACMLIRRPVAEVFNAFVDPAVTTKFWFSRASARLAQGATVTWHWDFYGVFAEVTVRVLEPNRRIGFDWPTPVEMNFAARGEAGTFVSVLASGFEGTDDDRIAQALDSTEGFNLVLAACKIHLEHGIEPRLIADKNPDGWVRER